MDKHGHCVNERERIWQLFGERVQCERKEDADVQCHKTKKKKKKKWMHPVSQVILHCALTVQTGERERRRRDRGRGRSERGDAERMGRERAKDECIRAALIHSECDSDANHSGCR